MKKLAIASAVALFFAALSTLAMARTNQAAVRSGSAQAQPQVKIVYQGNTKSKKVHSPSCRYFNCKWCRVEFSSKQAAIDAGYAPYKKCMP